LGIGRQIADTFLNEIKVALLDDVKADMEAYAKQTIARALKLLLIGVAGISILAIGSFFVLMSLVKYLSILLQAWMAWGIVGIVAIAFGGALLLMSRRE
jgi:hypothetical protein